MFDEDVDMGVPMSEGSDAARRRETRQRQARAGEARQDVTRHGNPRGPSAEGSLRDAIWSLHEAKRHLRTVAYQAKDEKTRSDARIAIASVRAILRDVLRDPDWM